MLWFRIRSNFPRQFNVMVRGLGRGRGGWGGADLHIFFWRINCVCLRISITFLICYNFFGLFRSRNLQCQKIFQANAPVNCVCLHPNQVS